MKASTLMWLALIVAVGVSMFLLKYKVQALEEELVAKQVQIAQDQDAIRVLEAEWAYFNDPDRLRRLSAEHLGLVQPSADQVKTIAALPFREGIVPLPKSRDETASPALQSSDRSLNHERASAAQPAATSAPRFLSVGPVFFARIQRYLMPAHAEEPFTAEGVAP